MRRAQYTAGSSVVSGRSCRAPAPGGLLAAAERGAASQLGGAAAQLLARGKLLVPSLFEQKGYPNQLEKMLLGEM